MLILKYERKDFFNHRIYTEDKKEHHTKEDLKKVFTYFGKTSNASIQIDNVVIFWDCLSEYENRVVNEINIKSHLNHLMLQNPRQNISIFRVCEIISVN